MEKENNENSTAEFNNKLIFEKSKEDLLGKDNQCKACQRQGFPLFLVRKAIIPKQFRKEIAWSTCMDNSNYIPLNNSQYAYRTLREGYVYILAEKKQDPTQFDVIAYEVTNSGAFREREFKDIKGSRPQELPIIQCIGQSHHLKAKFITVDNKRYDKIWLAYSFSRWSKETVEHYQQSPEHREKRFVAVDLTKTKPADMTENNRSFALSEFKDKTRHLFEIEYQHSVSDYFDEIAEKEEAAKTPHETIAEKLKFNNSKGVFAGVNMANLASLSIEGILDYFSYKFSTAHHFSPLADTAGQINAKFKKTVIDYGGKIPVIELDDSFGIAEELSIQRRQLLSPIINELLNSDYNRMELLKQKFNIGDKDQSNIYLRQDIETQEKEAMKTPELSSLHKAMYSDNILDLDNNNYRDINQFSNRTLTAAAVIPNLSITDWFTRKFTSYVMAKNRAETMVDFFKEQLNEVKSKPLAYFKPEMSYARKQKSQIDAFKQQLLETEQRNLEDNDDNPDWVFVFFDKNNTPVIANPDVIKLEKNNLYDLYLTYKDQVNDKTKVFEDNSITTLDNFDIIETIGIKELSQRIGAPYSVDAIRDRIRIYNYKGFLFKYLKYIGLSDFGFGDYRIIDIDHKQKEALLKIYKETDKNNKDQLLFSGANTEKTVNDVYVIEFTEARQKAAQYNVNQKWNQQNGKRIYTPSEQAFSTTDSAMLHQIKDYVKTVSEDYFTYCNDLFNNDQKQFPFWLYECEPDLSDSHINYLFSLLTIFDCNYMGNIELEEQEDFFASLFRDENTIYSHLLEGHEYSLFNIASGETNAPELTQQVKSLLFSLDEDSSEQATTPDLVTKLKFINDNHKYITGLKLKNNVTVGAYLQGEIVQITLNNATKSLSRGLNLQHKDIINKHIIKSMNAFSPGIVKQYTVTVPVNKVAYVIQDMENNFTQLSGTQKQLNTKIKTINNNYKSNLSGSKYGRTITATKEVIEYKYYVHFNDHQEQAIYEKKLKYVPAGQKAGSDNIFICDATGVNQDDLIAAFDYSAKLNRRTALVENSITSVFTGITIISQYYQLAELKSKLDDCLKNNSSQALYNKIQQDITRAHIQMVINTSTVLINLEKFRAIFLKKGNFFNLLNKASGLVGKVSATISIVDSIGTFAKASGALKRGEEGSTGFYITSAIRLVVAVVGFFAPISIPVTILIELCIAIISLFFEYDDGLMWDEMSKWLNRTMLGKFGRNDLLPPYPITDTGLYLSDQDYYLASSGGTLNMLSKEVSMDDWRAEMELKMSIDEQYRKEIYELNNITSIGYPEVNIYNDPIYKLHVPKAAKNHFEFKCSDLYLTLRLPNYSRINSIFEGHVTITHRYSGKTQTVFSFSKGDDLLNINKFTPSEDYLKAEPNDGMIRNPQDYYDYRVTESNTPQPTEPDNTWSNMVALLLPPVSNQIPGNPPQTAVSAAASEPMVGLYEIRQLLGRVAGGHYVTCFVSYWPEGKVDHNGDRHIPFLYAHQHNVNSLLESTTEWFVDATEIFSL